jgi:hypothetical protein
MTATRVDIGAADDGWTPPPATCHNAPELMGAMTNYINSRSRRGVPLRPAEEILIVAPEQHAGLTAARAGQFLRVWHLSELPGLQAWFCDAPQNRHLDDALSE